MGFLFFPNDLHPPYSALAGGFGRNSGSFHVRVDLRVAEKSALCGLVGNFRVILSSYIWACFDSFRFSFE